MTVKELKKILETIDETLPVYCAVQDSDIGDEPVPAITAENWQIVIDPFDSETGKGTQIIAFVISE